MDTRDEVDEIVHAMCAAGARKVGQIEDRPWGGRSGYVADPEGNRWEIAWAPGLGSMIEAPCSACPPTDYSDWQNRTRAQRCGGAVLLSSAA